MGCGVPCPDCNEYAGVCRCPPARQSYDVVAEQGRRPIKMWTRGVPVEHKAMDQLRDVASLPFVHKHVAAMPDIHWGIGATVGSVIPLRGAVVPAAVGVDIGCGMKAVRLGLTSHHLPENLEGVRGQLERAIPVGFAAHAEPKLPSHGSWARNGWPGFRTGYAEIVNAGLWHARQSPEQQVGTLGGGNHFVELCLDEQDRVWIMLHSGSRGLGNRVGRHFIELAKRECEKWRIRLPNPDLAYLPEETELFGQYVNAVSFCQDYAALNRDVMMRLAISALTHALGGYGYDVDREVVDCHHNYVARENHFGANVWVTRKGAVRARLGDLGIIPGSMGACSYIVRGKGNPESFNSCSHGAGRAMSRGEAKKRFTVEDHARATEGVACRKDQGVLDETPGAYKSIDAVMAAQADLVEVVHELRQVVCVKG